VFEPVKRLHEVPQFTEADNQNEADWKSLDFSNGSWTDEPLPKEALEERYRSTTSNGPAMLILGDWRLVP
jgi:hypothetical protein